MMFWHCLEPRVSGWQIFYVHNLSTFFPTTPRRNMPWLSFCFFTAACNCRRHLHRVPGAWGRTALHWAAANGHAAVVDRLISAGATVDAVDRGGHGPRRFSGRFWGGSKLEGVFVCFCTLAGDFFLCFGILSGVCCQYSRSLSVELGWVSWNSGVRHSQTWGT